ncbi:MAG: hypothetical protein U1E81_07880 [Xanthobacteraceae bacterium]
MDGARPITPQDARVRGVRRSKARIFGLIYGGFRGAGGSRAASSPGSDIR